MGLLVARPAAHERLAVAEMLQIVGEGQADAVLEGEEFAQRRIACGRISSTRLWRPHQHGQSQDE